jgi:hypothetical protein
MSAQDRAAADPTIPRRRIQLDAMWREYRKTLKNWKDWSYDLIGAPDAPKDLRLEDWNAVVADERGIDIARFSSRNTASAVMPVRTISVDFGDLGAMPISNTQRKLEPLESDGDFLFALAQWIAAVNVAYPEKGTGLGMRRVELEKYKNFIANRHARQRWSSRSWSSSISRCALAKPGIGTSSWMSLPRHTAPTLEETLKSSGKSGVGSVTSIKHRHSDAKKGKEVQIVAQEAVVVPVTISAERKDVSSPTARFTTHPDRSTSHTPIVATEPRKTEVAQVDQEPERASQMKKDSFVPIVNNYERVRPSGGRVNEAHQWCEKFDLPDKNLTKVVKES